MIPVSAGFKAKRASGKFPFGFRAEMYLPIQLLPYGASSSGSITNYPASAVVDGDRTSLNTGPAATAHNFIGSGVWKGGGQGSIFYNNFEDHLPDYTDLIATPYDGWGSSTTIAGIRFEPPPAFIPGKKVCLHNTAYGSNNNAYRLFDKVGAIGTYALNFSIGYTILGLGSPLPGEVIIGTYNGGNTAALRDFAVRIDSTSKIYLLKGTVQYGPYGTMTGNTLYNFSIVRESPISVKFYINTVLTATITSVVQGTADRVQINFPVSGNQTYNISYIEVRPNPDVALFDWVEINKADFSATYPYASAADPVGRVMLYGLPDAAGFYKFKLQHSTSPTGPWTTITAYDKVRGWEKWNGESAPTVAGTGEITLTPLNTYQISVVSVVELLFPAITDRYWRVYITDTNAVDKRARLCEIEMFQREVITNLVTSYEIGHSADITLNQINARTLALEMKNAKMPPTYSTISYPLFISEDFNGTSTGLRPELSIWESIDGEEVQVGYFTLDEPTLDSILHSASIVGRSRYEAYMYDRAPSTYDQDSDVTSATTRELEAINVPLGMYCCEPFWGTLRRFVPQGTARPVLQTLRESAQDFGLYVDGSGKIKNVNVRSAMAPLGETVKDARFGVVNDIVWNQHNDTIFWQGEDMYSPLVYFLSRSGARDNTTVGNDYNKLWNSGQTLSGNLYVWDITKPFTTASLVCTPLANYAFPSVSCTFGREGASGERWFFPGLGPLPNAFTPSFRDQDEVALWSFSGGQGTLVHRAFHPSSNTDYRVASSCCSQLGGKAISVSTANGGGGTTNAVIKKYDSGTMVSGPDYTATIAISSSSPVGVAKLVNVGTADGGQGTVYLIAGPIYEGTVNTGVRAFKLNSPWGLSATTLTKQSGTITMDNVTDVYVDGNIVWMATTAIDQSTQIPAPTQMIRWDTTQAIATATYSAAECNSGCISGVVNGLLYFINSRNTVISTLESWDGVNGTSPVQIKVMPTAARFTATPQWTAIYPNRWIGSRIMTQGNPRQVTTFWGKYPILCDRGTGPMALIMLNTDPDAAQDTLALNTTEALKEKISFEIGGGSAEAKAVQFTMYQTSETLSDLVYTEATDTASQEQKLVELSAPVDPATIAITNATLVRKAYRYPLISNSVSGATIKGTTELRSPITVMVRPENAPAETAVDLSIDTMDNIFVWNAGHATGLGRMRLRRTDGPTHWFDGEMIIMPHLEIGDYIDLYLPALHKTYTLQIVSITHAVDISEDGFTARASVELVERTLQ